MTALKTTLCLVLFFGTLVWAAWPIVQEGEVDWLYDMDIRGGVQIVYKADFSQLPTERQTLEEKQRLMDLSHLRLDARLANFQGVDVRVQRLGEDRLLVEVPGISNIAQVKADLGQPKVVYFARVRSLATSADDEHTHSSRLGSQEVWLAVGDKVSLGGNILYDAMKIQPGRPAESKQHRIVYRLSLPLDRDGEERMSKLTSEAWDEPATLPDGSPAVPLIALFLDDDLADIFVVRDRAIRQGAITSPSEVDAENLKGLLSSGPMPLPFEVYSERSISPLIGSELQEKGVFALILSIVLLIAFIGLCYLDRPWFLLVYGVTLFFWFLCLVILANLHFLRISTLQLAGFALLLGMNTDAMVLVFEDLQPSAGQKEKFRLDLVGKAFKAEWMVIFWGMFTTVVVIVPLAMQGGIFTDYVKLIAMGMVINVIGFAFARLIMSLPVAEELSRLRLASAGWAKTLAKVNLTGRRYRRVAPILAVLSVIAVVVYPKIPLAPIFAGGKALEVSFDSPVAIPELQNSLQELLGRSADVMVEAREGQTTWALVKYPAEISVNDQDVLQRLTSSLGVTPSLVAIETVSRTLVSKTRVGVSFEMFIGFLGLIVISVVIYNVRAGGLILLALLHDLVICLGLMAVVRISLDLPAVAALAVVAGYSINDSIVVLHKLKQTKLDKEKELGRELDPTREEDLPILANLRIQNLKNIPARVLITSITTVLPMLMIALLVGGISWDYGLVVLSGVLFGTLSSIYIVGRIVPDRGFVSWSQTVR